MFTRCIFCRTSLGANEVIEALPIGRRVAFDAAKGRLWVVCTQCGQWNLTPFEERWEALETAERLFVDAKRRVSGEQIGLAKLREGLELVRIGKPLRPEFAAWRYGDQFGKRRRDALLAIGGGVAIGGVVVTGGLALGVGIAAMPMLSLVANAALARSLRKRLILSRQDGTQLVLSQGGRENARIVERADAEGGWGIDVEYHGVIQHGAAWPERDTRRFENPLGIAHLSGRDAVHAAERLMSKSAARAIGTRPKHIDTAVTLIEDAGGPDEWFRVAARSIRKWAPDQLTGPTGGINHLPQPVRLALEMAAHEETERRALQGELAELEARWREAEEIAAIADDMFLPASVTAFLERIRSGVKG